MLSKEQNSQQLTGAEDNEVRKKKETIAETRTSYQDRLTQEQERYATDAILYPEKPLTVVH